jgi:hypothetical protein
MKNLEDICRCCLKCPAKENLLKFSENISKTRKIFECFETVTQLAIVSGSARICRDCLDQLKISHEFKQKCLENDDKYWKLVKNWKRKEGSGSRDLEVILVKDEVASEEDLEIKEESMEFEAEEIQDFEEANQSMIAKFIPLKGPEFRCRYCDREFKSKGAKRIHRMHEIRVHIIKGHTPIYPEPSEIPALEESLVNDGEFQCRFCSRVFASKNAKRTLRSHEMKVHLMKDSLGTRSEAFKNKCRFCFKVFDSKNARVCLRNHEITVSFLIWRFLERN